MEDNKEWRVSVTIDEVSYDYSWKPMWRKDTLVGCWGRVFLAGDRTTAVSYKEEVPDWITPAVSNAARMIRYTQLRNELQIDKIEISFDASGSNYENIILELYKMNNEGVYVGQMTNNQMLYVQDIAEFLTMPVDLAMSYVNKLIEAGKIGLSGMVFIDYEDYASALKEAEARNGHKEFFPSDTGTWYCQACNTFGDEYDNPKDFPCE